MLLHILYSVLCVFSFSSLYGGDIDREKPPWPGEVC